MAVPNRFSTRSEDREHLLRSLATVGALVGVGFAAGLMAVRHVIPGLPGLYLTGWVLAFVLGLALAARVWLVPKWDLLHGLLALALGATWILLGFTGPVKLGSLEAILGAGIAGVGLGGIATERRWTWSRIRVPIGGQ